MLEAVPRERLTGDVGPAAAEWFISQYQEPERFPAVLVGATNGAVADFAAATGAPWLPQTFLLLVRALIPDVDDIHAVIETSRPLTARLARCFPDAVAHQMHDPQNDRLNVRHANYLRMKWQRLPNAYRRFIENRLQPGGTIFIVDCTYKWPALRLSDTHFLQIGGHGGRDAGSILRSYGLAGEAGWEPLPEAEWAYDDALTADLVELALARRFRVVRMTFDRPQDFSAPVSRFFRACIATDEPGRLVVTNFNMLAPAHVLLTRAVPYWSVFNDVRSLEGLNAFLDESGPFDEIDSLLFQNGVVAEGQADAQQWLDKLRTSAPRARLVGVSPDQHPFDFAAFDRYQRDFRRVEARSSQAAGPRMTPDAALRFLEEEALTLERIA